MFDPIVDGDIPHYPSCHLCGRVLTNEDHTAEAGFDDSIHWCSRLHSPEGLDELAAWIEFDAAEQERIKVESGNHLQALIDAAVRDALEARGIR
jgi:hypothetical protein